MVNIKCRSLNTGMKIQNIMKAKLESNIRVPHATLLHLEIGIGVSVLAVLAIATLDGGIYSVEEAFAAVKLKSK